MGNNSVALDEPLFAANNQFFSHLVDLIPAKYYRQDEQEHVELRFLPKDAKFAAKQDFKKQAKANKRKKLNPDGAEGQAGAGSSSEEEGEPADEQPQPGPGSAQTAARLGSSSHCSREELQARLHKKIEDVQQQRGGAKKDKKQVAKEAKEWRQKTLQDNVKQKQQEQQAGNKRKAPAASEQQQQGQRARKKGDTSSQDEGQDKPQGEQADADFQFARIEFEDKKQQHGKKKLNKQQLLEQAEAKAQEAAAAEANEDAKVRQASEAWKSAMARAGGDKVLDDPKLLRRSLKKEAKRKDKHSKAWQERKASQEEQQAKRQEKRKANLQARSKAKIDKKKSKSDKKLLRAGFEGRKAGFIGGGKKK